jgi:hypothetical protein
MGIDVIATTGAFDVPDGMGPAEVALIELRVDRTSKHVAVGSLDTTEGVHPAPSPNRGTDASFVQAHEFHRPPVWGIEVMTRSRQALAIEWRDEGVSLGKKAAFSEPQAYRSGAAPRDRQALRIFRLSAGGIESSHFGGLTKRGGKVNASARHSRRFPQ